MTSLDLDPLFVKALKLLHSRSKDSTDQLREMVDEAIAQRRAQLKGIEIERKQKLEDDPVWKRENEKKQLEKLKQDLSELSQEAPAKKPRTHSPSPEKISSTKDKEQEREREKEKEKIKKEKDARERREADKKEKLKQEREKDKEREREREKEKEKKKKETKKIEDSDSDQGMDADDIAFGLGISCVVCRLFDVTSSNKLIECQECHNLYHQECHKPPVVEQDVDDPRFVWYCTRCVKNMKKMAQSKPTKPKPTSSQPVAAFTKEMTTLLKPPKTESSSSLLFRRAEPKTSSSKDSTASSGSKPLSGLASLAANLAGKGTVDSNKPHSSKVDPSKLHRPDPFKSLLPGRSDQSDRPTTAAVSLLKPNPKPVQDQSKTSLKTVASTKPTQGATLAASADKRLQQMKKKAAAKMQDRRAR
ncbi:hypothetical protein ScPMuIL_015475 [Solemya velum]